MSPNAETWLGKRLLIVSGKGGVGKSTVSAALARLLADGGRSVLIVELDPRESQHQLFDTPPSAGAIVNAGPSIRLQNVDPGQVLAEVMMEQLGSRRLGRRIARSHIFRQVVAGVPGLTEMAVLGHAWRATHGRLHDVSEPIDVVIIDAPASGHGAALIAAPRLVQAVVADGPFGAMAADLPQALSSPDETALVAVTHAEQLPVRELLELCDIVGDSVGRAPDLLIVNGMYPQVPHDGTPSVAPLSSPEGLWARRRQVNERELSRLRRRFAGPILTVPLLAIERGPALVSAIAAILRDRPLRGARAR